jgi:hypothetical protein
MKSPRIIVTIDRLVLRGFPAEQRSAISAGLTGELERQLRSVPPQAFSSRASAVLDAGTVQPQRRPDGIGVSAARNILARLHPRSGPKP